MSKSLEPSFSKRTPNGDTHGRNVCDHCEYVAYENPKIVVGSVVRHEGKILLCRRAIEPRKGYWTIPAGYMELGETPQKGAMREAREEANADLSLSELLAVYTVERLSQVQILYRATLNSPEFSAGEESLEVELFAWKVAFPTVHWALEHDRQIDAGEAKAPFENPEGQVADL